MLMEMSSNIILVETRNFIRRYKMKLYNELVNSNFALGVTALASGNELIENDVEPHLFAKKKRMHLLI